MKVNKALNNKMYIIAVILPIFVILFPLGYSISSFVFAREVENPQPFLERPDAKYKNCVKETDYMRFHHWELLGGIREEIVRFGKTGDITLNRCRECHTSRERFCDKCHNTVSMKPDCFDCHYYP